MNVILASIIVLGSIGLLASCLLYIASRKFHVDEDPRIGLIESILPGANCGGCGFSGCHAFAVACAGAESLQSLHCTSLDPEGRKALEQATGLKAEEGPVRKALVGCEASCSLNPPVNSYVGVKSCAIEAAFYQGESECVYGCLGGGDCVRACPFGALSQSPDSIVPTVDFDLCTACGQCVAACPRKIISLVEIPENRSVYQVACRNTDKGPVAVKECKVSCIGCGKCIKTCDSKAVKVSSFLASIDASSCVGCGKCADACPRGSIVEISLQQGLQQSSKLRAMLPA